jgi:hypothetical protein
MRESRTYGSVRGAGSNPRPYRDRLERCTKVVKYLRYCGRAAQVIGTAVRDPKPSFGRAPSCKHQTHNC